MADPQGTSRWPELQAEMERLAQAGEWEQALCRFEEYSKLLEQAFASPSSRDRGPLEALLRWNDDFRHRAESNRSEILAALESLSRQQKASRAYQAVENPDD